MNEKQSEQHFRVDVSSLGEVKLEDLKIKNLSEELTEGWNLHESLKDFQPKTEEIEFVLKSFESANLLEAQVLQWASENGFRPAFPSERNAILSVRTDIPTTEDYDYVSDLGSWRAGRSYPRSFLIIRQSGSTKTPTRLLTSTGEHLGGLYQRYLFVKI